jgi:hypothetical protein
MHPSLIPLVRRLDPMDSLAKPRQRRGWTMLRLTKKGMDDAQITGSASSYARKYALNGLFAIDDTKDPDSTNTHGKGKTPKPQQNETANALEGLI